MWPDGGRHRGAVSHALHAPSQAIGPDRFTASSCYHCEYARAPRDLDVMESERTGERIDVMIGGGGFAGLALAIALRQGLGPSFSVTVADPALARAGADGRASAIVAAARRLFEVIGVWHQVEAQPILDMVVSDSRLHDVVRPTFLTFEGDLEPGEPFAHMIENAPLLAALTDKARQEGVALRSSAV